MTLLSSISRLTRTAISLTRTALAPVRAALYLPTVHSTQSDEERRAAETARAMRMLSLLAEDVDEHTRARAVNALNDIDAALQQLRACLDPGSLPGAPGEDAEARERRTFNTMAVATASPASTPEAL